MVPLFFLFSKTNIERPNCMTHFYCVYLNENKNEEYIITFNKNK